MIDVEQAERDAACLLAAEHPARWQHVKAVAEKAASIADTVASGHDARILVAAAWLHDIGYSSGIARIGFHPLDGAQWIDDHGYAHRIAALVAHHSCAQLEAEERGILLDFTRFPREISPVADALWYADMTTGPNGQSINFNERVAQIRLRYGSRHVVTRFIDRAENEIGAAIERTVARLA